MTSWLDLLTRINVCARYDCLFQKSSWQHYETVNWRNLLKSTLGRRYTRVISMLFRNHGNNLLGSVWHQNGISLCQSSEDTFNHPCPCLRNSCIWLEQGKFVIPSIWLSESPILHTKPRTRRSLIEGKPWPNHDHTFVALLCAMRGWSWGTLGLLEFNTWSNHWVISSWGIAGDLV